MKFLQALPTFIQAMSMAVGDNLWWWGNCRLGIIPFFVKVFLQLLKSKTGVPLASLFLELETNTAGRTPIQKAGNSTGVMASPGKLNLPITFANSPDFPSILLQRRLILQFPTLSTSVNCFRNVWHSTQAITFCQPPPTVSHSCDKIRNTSWYFFQLEG